MTLCLLPSEDGKLLFWVSDYFDVLSDFALLKHGTYANSETANASAHSWTCPKPCGNATALPIPLSALMMVTQSSSPICGVCYRKVSRQTAYTRSAAMWCSVVAERLTAIWRCCRRGAVVIRQQCKAQGILCSPKNYSVVVQFSTKKAVPRRDASKLLLDKSIFLC